ncbi:hypothetical protein LTR98_002443 [Exophiala xenobiotica]|nr:hypothetical protein LTR98_002443 [Exophiala xenobiotica]
MIAGNLKTNSCSHAEVTNVVSVTFTTQSLANWKFALTTPVPLPPIHWKWTLNKERGNPQSSKDPTSTRKATK